MKEDHDEEERVGAVVARKRTKEEEEALEKKERTVAGKVEEAARALKVLQGKEEEGEWGWGGGKRDQV